MAGQKSTSLEGKRLGKYMVGKLIGAGATGDVYRGRSRAGKNVAIKVLDPKLVRDLDSSTRFQREAEIGQRLTHPNIVKVLDVGKWRGTQFIVMELLRGSALRRLMNKGNQPEKVTAALSQVANALMYAHEAGVVHRDLKPENILLTRSGAAKVADFGLASVCDATTLTTHGAMLGTAKYMSPEQARGQPADAASDVYSMGVILYEALSGELPFSSDTHHGYIFQHAEKSPKKPRVRKGYSPALGKLAMRCLAKSRDARPSMSDVAEQLKLAVCWQPRRWPWLVTSAGLALVVLTGVVVFQPQILTPLTGQWVGAPLFRGLQDAAVAVREFLLW